MFITGKMVNQRKVIFALVTLFLFSLVSSVGAIGTNDIPSNVTLQCDTPLSVSENPRVLNFNETITSFSQVLSHGYGFDISIYKSGDTSLTLNIYPNSQSCQVGTYSVPFLVNGNSFSVTYIITTNLYNLDAPILSKGNAYKIASSPTVFFELKTVASGVVSASVSGCSSSSNNRDYNMNEGESVSFLCGSQQYKFKLNSVFPSLNNADFDVFCSQPYDLKIVVGQSGSDDECILGLNTLGAKVKRGNSFSIKTINIKNNKALPKVAVTVLDQTGELSPLSGESDSIGFFTIKLQKDYEEDLTVLLEKEDCEPYTGTILFDVSYDDYLAQQQQESGGKQLQIILDEQYNTGTITGIVKNLLDEGVKDAKVKITKPDKTAIEVTTTEDGTFNFTAETVGVWKFQATKDAYESSELLESEILSSQYSVVKIVGGQELIRFKKGDLITFEIRDKDNKIIPVTFEAKITSDTLDDEQISFLEGVSEEYLFRSDATLEIPAVGGYDSDKVVLRKEVTITPSWVYWGGGGLGLLVLIIIIIAIRKSNKKKRRVTPMAFQLGEEMK